MIERHASEHLPKTSQLFDLADMASALAAFISKRTTRFESGRGAATLLLLCVNWCPATIYLHAIMRQLQYVDVFEWQFVLLAAQMFARCLAAVAIRGWIRPAIFAAGCTHICTLMCDSCNALILPAISAAGCGYLQLNYIWHKHLAWQKCQFTFSIMWRCSNATAARCFNSALTSNKQKPVVTTLNTVRIIKYFPTP